MALIRTLTDDFALSNSARVIRKGFCPLAEGTAYGVASQR